LHTRRNTKDPCLSVTVDTNTSNAVWKCHHCGWSGRTRDVPEPNLQRRRPTRRPSPDAIERPLVEVVRWFADRGIPIEIIQRNRIDFVRERYMPQLDARSLLRLGENRGRQAALCHWV
jgi:twinkle protein